MAVAVEADDSLTGANYHAIERGDLASGPRHDIEPPPLAQDDFAAVVDEPEAIEEPAEEEIETPVEDEADDAEDRSPAREGRESRESREGGPTTATAAAPASPAAARRRSRALAKASRPTRRSRPTTDSRWWRRSAAISTRRCP